MAECLGPFDPSYAWGERKGEMDRERASEVQNKKGNVPVTSLTQSFDVGDIGSTEANSSILSHMSTTKVAFQHHFQA